MKTLLISLLLSTSALAQTKPDNYEQYLQSVQRELHSLGTQIDPNTPNPFITGSALQGYFLNEKVLLLERDAFFMMKSNKLETTEEVADYQHRLKVLASHANNILLGLVRSFQTAKQEGFRNIEAPKHQQLWEELVEQCKKDSECVSKKLASGELVVRNDIVDTFALSLQFFKQIPYMHAVEFASSLQLVQLLQMEALLGHSKVSKVEFDLFIKKQSKLLKEIESNRQLTQKEKEYHRTVIANTVNKWKKKILEKKFDSKAVFLEKAQKLRVENQRIMAELEKLRVQNPAVLSEKEFCRRWTSVHKDRKNCDLRAKLEDHLLQIRTGKTMFIGTKEKKIPEDFWKNI